MTNKEKELSQIKIYEGLIENKNYKYLTYIGFKDTSYVGKFKQYNFEFKCVCGKEVIKCNRSLFTSTENTSCGCKKTYLKKGKEFKTAKILHYQIWNNLKNRYGIEGEWLDVKVFSKDYTILTQNLSKNGFKLYPLDANKPLSKTNYQIISKKENQNHRKNSLNITYQGETKTLQQWCDKFLVAYTYMYRRVIENGLNFEDVLKEYQIKKPLNKIHQYHRGIKITIIPINENNVRWYKFEYMGKWFETTNIEQGLVTVKKELNNA